MKIQLLKSSSDAASDLQYASCYLINNTIAIDAGPLGLWGSPKQQSAVRHVFLTHTHLDHIATLPIFLENAWDPGRDAVVVYGRGKTIQDFRAHILNDVIWPDFVRLSRPEAPFLQFRELQTEGIIEVEGLRFLPVDVNHTIPTYGYIVSDGRSTVIFGSDSGPTERIWELARQMPAPRFVFLEAAFPNAMGRLAKITGHLTPELFGREISKMPAMQSIFAIHIKAGFRERILRELGTLGIDGLVIVESGKTYEI